MKYSKGDTVTMREGFYASQKLMVLRTFRVDGKNMYFLAYDPLVNGVRKTFWQPENNLKKIVVIST